ncbi:MAG: FAD-dependent oxidoreductase [Paenacidovorax caeni]
MTTHHSDVLIVGAGPAGLSLAISLAQAGFTATVVEQQSDSALAAPAPDGREIALTHPSRDTLQRLGSWGLLAGHEVGTICEAQVHDGPLGQHSALQLSTPQTPEGAAPGALGFIVPNHALRRTAYAVAARTPGCKSSPRPGSRAQPRWPGMQSWTMCGRYRWRPTPAPDGPAAGGRRQPLFGHAPPAGHRRADDRLWPHRHRLPHAPRPAPWQRGARMFGYDRTLAVLPLPDDPQAGHALCSVVVTAGAADAAALMAQSPEAFAAQVQAQFNDRLGTMALVGERHAYPLVAVYAQRFAGHRCALLGDAAVGMHPVTAHGYNLGLAGVERLTAALSARQRGQDMGSADALAPTPRATTATPGPSTRAPTPSCGCTPTPARCRACCASWCCRARAACRRCRRPSWGS